MTHEHDTFDISQSPDLVHLVEEVRRTNTPTILRRDNEDVAVIIPIADRSQPTTRRPAGRKKSPADIEAFLAAAGGWKDLVDTDKLKRDIAKSRARSNRPPIAL